MRGNMCCGVLNDDLVVRVAREDYERILAKPHVRPMNFTGRPLKGFVYLSPKGCKTDPTLRKWLQQAIDFVLSLPTKTP